MKQDFPRFLVIWIFIRSNKGSHKYPKTKLRSIIIFSTMRDYTAFDLQEKWELIDLGAEIKIKGLESNSQVISQGDDLELVINNYLKKEANIEIKTGENQSLQITSRNTGQVIVRLMVTLKRFENEWEFITIDERADISVVHQSYLSTFTLRNARINVQIHRVRPQTLYLSYKNTKAMYNQVCLNQL